MIPIGMPSMIEPPLPIAEVDALWRQTLGNRRVCVAVLDGAANLSLPCFTGSSVECLEAVVGCAARSGLSCDHGTTIASIFFGQHKAGSVRGLAPGCRGVIVPIFRDATDGAVAPCSQVDLARAINQALAYGAHVINVSAGQLSPSGQAHPLLADAVQNCVRQGTLVVSAVGNDGCECLHIPERSNPCWPSGRFVPRANRWHTAIGEDHLRYRGLWRRERTCRAPRATAASSAKAARALPRLLFRASPLCC